jgi:methylenetetrahydrofolate dehydrogenase (NADP+)/methenyltetrahydrofolate cyclohydrolase
MILDGKTIAEKVRAEVRAGVARFIERHGRAPGLDVILVGEDPASQVYTRNKEKAAKDVGIRGRLDVLPATTSEAELLARIAALDADPSVDGILVQLPLPAAIAKTAEIAVLDAVSPDKDVDGFHPRNAGLLASGRPSLVPCTPLGCMRLLEEARLAGVIEPRGARALVVGRSNIVGRPVAQLLLNAHATVTLAHSQSRDLPALCREADILVAAVGQPELIRGDWVKPGAVVIDVGINRVPAGEGSDPGKTRLVGDVAFAEAKERAGAITPVPGGVGPLTIAYLLSNTLRAAELRAR